MGEMFISIIIPAYNEAKRIKPTILGIYAYLREKPYSYEVIVVNDGSKDDTAYVVEKLSLELPHLKLIDNVENKGKGYAVKMGMLAARGSARLFMDADGATSVDHLEKMLPYLTRGYGVVTSSRYAPGAVLDKPQPALRAFLGRVFRLFVQLIVPLGVEDTQNGFKLFTADAAEEIFSRLTVYRWAFDVEVLAIARTLGFTLREVPIRWRDDERSKMTLKGMIHMIVEVMVVRTHLWFGKYFPKPYLVRRSSLI